MALGAAQLVTAAGAAPTYAEPAASDTFAWPTGASSVLVHVKNANAGACTVTVTSRALPSDGLVATNKTVTVPADTGDRIFRVSPAFRDGDGVVTMAFSVQTSVLAAVLY